MFNFTSLSSDPVRLNTIIKETPKVISDEEYVEELIQEFLASGKRKEMIDGERYYEGDHDILAMKRTIIGEGGSLQEVDNLPNNRIIDNQYQKMVDQKKNYLLGKPIVFGTEDNKKYNDLLKQTFNRKFQRLIKNIGEDSLNCGIAWMFVNYNEHGELEMKRLKPYQVIPIWLDYEHEELEAVIYFYDWEANGEVYQKVEVYDENGIYRFIRKDNRIIPDDVPFSTYFSLLDENGEELGLNWLKIPVIPWRYNTKEIPLIRKVRSLQDGINAILSTFMNNMQEDARNTILVLVNYDGQDLGEFRRNLSQYGAVKVRNDGTGGGGVDTLQVEVNAENYQAILRVLKNALIENARGFDAKDDRLNGEPNQMNIQSMYSDVDLDANEMETEYQASFEELLEFVNTYYSHKGLGDYDVEDVEVVFNRDILINESEVIANIRQSTGVLSRKTQVRNHPWINDVDEEMNLINQEEMIPDDYGNAFKKVNPNEEVE